MYFMILQLLAYYICMIVLLSYQILSLGMGLTLDWLTAVLSPTRHPTPAACQSSKGHRSCQTTDQTALDLSPSCCRIWMRPVAKQTTACMRFYEKHGAWICEVQGTLQYFIFFDLLCTSEVKCRMISNCDQQEV